MSSIASNLPESLKRIYNIYGEQIKLNIVIKKNNNEYDTINGWDNIGLLDKGKHEHIKAYLANLVNEKYQNELIGQDFYRYAFKIITKSSEKVTRNNLNDEA
jgi:hypothetical protein